MASQLYNNTAGSGSFWPGAIIGDLPNPEGAASLAPTQFFTSGDQDAGGDGEVSGLTAFTVEFWFRADALPASNELVFYGPMTTTGIGTREWWFTLNSAGTLSFSARTNTPASIGTTGGVAVPGVFSHLVGRVDGSNLKLFQNGVEVATTAWGGASVQARGTTGGSMDTIVGNPSSTQTYSYDEIAIYRASLGADRILAHYQAGTQRGFPNGALPGERCIAALDAISSHAPRRTGAGSRSMIADFYAGQSALDALQNARLAENVDSTLFASKSGEVVFLDAAHRSSAPYNTVQMTAGDAGGAEIPYEDVGVDWSDATIANEWTVAITNGISQVVSDATSIASYGRRPQSITGLPFLSDANALAIGTAMLAKYKDPILRGTSITLNTGDPSVAEVAFDRDLADRINVKRTPPGGGVRISQDLFIQQIEISGANDGTPWQVHWGLSPL